MLGPTRTYRKRGWSAEMAAETESFSASPLRWAKAAFAGAPSLLLGGASAVRLRRRPQFNAGVVDKPVVPWQLRPNARMALA